MNLSKSAGSLPLTRGGAHPEHMKEEASIMTILQHLEQSTLTLAFDGRLDYATAPQFSEVVATSLKGVTTLILDLAHLEYISSAGLCVILTAQNAMEKQGEMKVIHVNETIMEIFDITGFVDLLTIE